MAKSEKVLVLTTHEYDYWASMQEVLPAFEGVWRDIGATGRHQVEFLRADLDEVSRVRDADGDLLETTWIVLAAATPATVRVALELRRDLASPARMAIYSHGDVTTGFQAFGELSTLLTSSDELIVACHAEALIAKHLFKNLDVRVVPWPLVDQYRTVGRDPMLSEPTTRLACVGRVSEQKNIHTTLFALWILKNISRPDLSFSLEIFGGEDGHGSPNMGMPGSTYGEFLKELIETLALDSLVTWNGFKDREELFANLHARPHVLVSASLHSDENFGSSILSSLSNGRDVVATAWGGHHDFEPWFPTQLRLVPVQASAKGPVVDPGVLASTIASVCDSSGATVDTEVLRAGIIRFSQAGVVEDTMNVLEAPQQGVTALEPSAALRELEARRSEFGGGRKIFRDYADQAAQAFFAAYGMNGEMKVVPASPYLLAPWVHVDTGSVSVTDPHRGDHTYTFDADSTAVREVVSCPSLTRRFIPESTLGDLVRDGYAFEAPGAMPRA